MALGTRRIMLAMAVLGLALSTEARADAIFNVTLNTAGLSVPPGSDSGPFGLFFQLTDGSGTGDANNTVTVSGFDFGGGALLQDTGLFDGGVTGDPITALTLTDSSFFSFFFQQFVPGNVLSFVLTMTTNANGVGLPPDAFGFSILDGMGAPIPSLDPTLADTLLTVNIDSLSPSIAAYGSDPARTNLGVNPPEVTPVPEPATLLLTGSGLGLIGLARRRRKDASG